jgi:phage tail sheath protein FI
MGSANVTVNIIDQSQPVQAVATGIPAGIIGTAETGPAFVPVTFTTYGSWKTLFGESGDKFGPVAVSQWLSNASQATYLRVLGIGDGKKRSAATGQITNAGFVVGNQTVQETGVVSRNTYANNGGVLGRTHFLGAFMSESAGSTIFSDSGLQTSGQNVAYPIIRGIIMTPSGVALTLSGNYNTSNSPGSVAGSNGGGITGSMTITGSMFVMLLNGHINTSDYPSIITASLEIGDNHISKKLNLDPALTEKAGHYLYAYYDIPSSLALFTGSGVFVNPFTVNDATYDIQRQDVVFVTTSSIARNTSTAVIPNYENFSERYATPHTPSIISQDFGGTKYPLFKVYALSDGANASKRYKILIENITPSKDPAYNYGKFDLAVLGYDSDTVLQRFNGINLDPTSTSYIARAIGDQHVYFDFDKAQSSQKLAVEGDYQITGNYIRVEMSNDVILGNAPPTSLPFGFRGYGQLVTSGSILASGSDPNTMQAGHTLDIQKAVIPPVPMRMNIAPGGVATSDLAWGTQLELQSLSDYNYTDVYNDSVASFVKFFPSFAPSDAKFFVEDSSNADNFNKNLFSIEKIKVVTASNTYADPAQWASAVYVRAGNITADGAAKTRALTIDDLSNITSKASQYVSFEVIMQGGFDGVNIFDAQKSAFTNLAIKREIDDAGNQGGTTSGPTIVAYRKAVDIMGSKSDADIQLLAIPGIRHASVTNYAITAVENRFDAMYIMDIETRDAFNAVITGSSSTIDVSYTVDSFSARNLNTSFASSYFPDVTVVNPDTGNLMSVPPSVVALGALATNDKIGSYWNAPAGFTRAGLSTVVDSSVALSQDDLDILYDASINPIVSFPGTGFVVWGQKTLLQAASSLDRINVRRLLIFLRRQVRQVANSLLFEPNTQATLDKFNALVNPILQRIQAGGGVDRYKVQIDTTTTTQADIENNTIRGKIYVQPTRTAEFISIDFVVTGRSTSV